MSERLDLRNQPPLADHERPDRPSRLSQSFLRHYANCPRSGAFYLLFRGGAPSHPMGRGSAAHLIAERMGKHALEYGEATVPHELVREIVNEVVADPSVHVAPSEIDFLHTIAYHLAEALAFDPETIVGLERKVVMEIGGWRVVGKIDLAWVAGERAGVKDYKTSLNLPDNSAWGPAETDDGKKRIRRFLFQTLLYALLLKYGRPVALCDMCGGTGEPPAGSPFRETCPICDGEGEMTEDTPLAPRAQEFEIAEVYPAYMYEDDSGVKRLAERSTTITLDELENHRRWLEALIGKVDYAFDTGEWPAVPGSHCAECPAQSLCPIPAVLRGGVIDLDTGEVIGPIDSTATARRALALRDRLMHESGELWEAVKAWADQGNVIIVGDQAYEFTPSSTTSVRKSKGKNDWDGLVDAIDRAAETGEDFNRDYWIKKTTSTRFQKRALRPDEKTPDYPEEVGDGNEQRGASDSEPGRSAADGSGPPGARFGDDAPF